ncbi:MAG: hypothetical protein Q8M94_13390 [Ignavibacteria bacterium]|nr:hypothetical protein [Ignavibacteria bacterium]
MNKQNGYFVTTLFLNKPFRNKVHDAPVLHVTAPNGYDDWFRQSGLSENSQHVLMWKECGCVIDRIPENREVRGCVINGINLTYGDTLNILEYVSETKEIASERYHKKIKPGLLKMNYLITDYICNPFAKLKPEPNCLDGTILDPKYNKE